MSPSRSARAVGSIVLGLGAIGIVAGYWTEPVAASNVAAGLGDDRTLTVPTWLTLLTGGAAVGASALLAALVTDRRFVDTVHEWGVPLAAIAESNPTESSPGKSSPAESSPVGSTGLSRRTVAAGSLIGGGLGVLGLAAVIVVGLEGPTMPTANLAVIIAFVGVRAVLPMVAFLVVDPWPTIDPFRTLARGVDKLVTRVRELVTRVRERVRRRPSNPSTNETNRTDGTNETNENDSSAVDSALLEYPTWLSSWPAVLGLGALVWLELVLPITTDTELLAFTAVGYAGYTVTGAVLFSPTVWFRRADPLAVLFRLYGAVAPIQRRDGTVRLVVPGARLRDADVVTDSSDVAFVVLLVWELTFNGFVVTRPGRRVVEALVATGLPARVVYLALLVGGFAVALAVYWLAAHLSRRTAPTYLSERVLARRFAPPLLAIAAGYHLAHYVTFVVSLAPASLAALSSPFAPPVNPTTLVVPGWMGTLEIATLLAGHVLAIWTAHAIAFDCVPGRLQAIRSQYPFVVVMVCYTALSLWLLTLPTMEPVYVAG
ncbi:hypothetical protein [Natronorubrum texcoconense]|uniref:hypothetical protein n=1 Tax=Natronorubrum texcoconense TaxID=1095776 RepID=UPI001FDF3B64|nr:hypothetical protein [Natronorubrum texcoconense]